MGVGELYAGREPSERWGVGWGGVCLGCAGYAGLVQGVCRVYAGLRCVWGCAGFVRECGVCVMRVCCTHVDVGVVR